MNKITLITESADMTQVELLSILDDALTAHEYELLMAPARMGMETLEYYEGKRARVAMAIKIIGKARYEVQQ